MDFVHDTAVLSFLLDSQRNSTIAALDIRHAIDDEGRKDVLKAADNMGFDDLGGNVDDEDLL